MHCCRVHDINFSFVYFCLRKKVSTYIEKSTKFQQKLNKGTDLQLCGVIVVRADDVDLLVELRKRVVLHVDYVVRVVYPKSREYKVQ